MTIILAKMLGLYFLTIGLALLINPERFKRFIQDILNNDTLLLWGAFFGVLLGAFIIATHNVWIAGWPVVITIIGWWSLIKSFGILISEKFVHLFSSKTITSDTGLRIASLAWLALGLFLSYQGWS